MRAHNRLRSEGQIAVMTAVVIFVLFGAAGLVIDAGVGYIVKAKLNAAVDAAGIAAARAVSQGATQADQTSNAILAAQKFFDANYPAGYLRSVPAFDTPVITFARGESTINLSATASVPVNVMGMFGFTVLTVSATTQAVRRAIDMAYVIDTSGSLQSVASGVRTDATFFLSLFNQLEDRVALIHFAYGAVVDVPFKTDQSRGFNRSTMNTLINGYSFDGNTNFADGLWNARDQLKNKISPANYSSLRVIVFFSDGSPNTFASYFKFKTSSDCTSPGALVTGDAATGTPGGLYYHNQASQALPGICYQDTNIISRTGSPGSYQYRYVTTPLPTYYNPHDKLNEQEFRVVTATPRQVLATPAAAGASNFQNAWNASINRAARNLAESIALQARTEGIYVYTLGLGDLLHGAAGPDNEQGEDLLKCMANTPNSLSRCYNPNLPVGRYCWAADIAALKSCFAEIASEILRLTK